ALTPMLKKLIAANADFNVLEMDSSTLKSHEMPYFMQANRAGEVVPQADLLVITGTTLINDTLEGLLSMAKPGAEIVVTGPTVSMLPDAFFFRGVTSLGGIVVTDADALLDIISEGGSGYHFFGKFADRSVIKSEE
ncbi:MAG TPA: Fis family transcriptional regulator, partial [Clostridiales bacterium]|nr:Fis family transcriptional regulator [Clostridiales bacterium]